MNSRVVLGSWSVVSLALLALLATSGALAGEGEFGIQFGAVMPDKEISGESGEVEPLLGLRGGYRFTEHWGWMLDAWLAELDALDTEVTNPVTEEAQTIAVRAAAQLMFGPETKKHRMFTAFGAGWMNFDLTQNAVGRPFLSIGLGQRYTIGSQKYLHWELRGDRTVNSDTGFNESNVTMAQFLVGMSWGIGGHFLDEDSDGVPDRKDECPGTPQAARVDRRGCPLDEDGDGVPDGIDRCPGTPAGWPVDDKGCPIDSDGDGVPDGADSCPGTPAGAKVDEKGCPLDSDGDGVYDGLDKCPDTPKGATVDANGCPIDSDGDGVPDGIDQCPDTPKGAIVDARGCPLDGDGDGVPDGIDQCPDTPKGTMVDATGCPTQRLSLQPVHFEFDSSELTAKAKKALDTNVAQLRQYPGTRIELQGYTDSTGAGSYNNWLSAQRAKAAYDYMVSKGVATNLLIQKGYGASNPLDDNDTPEGRKRNRRVELALIK